jgi:hypothetical protein
VFGLLDSGMFIKGSSRKQQITEARARRAAVTG